MVVYVNPSLPFNCIRGVIAEALHKHVGQIWTTVVSVNVVTFWSDASIGCKFDPTGWIQFLLPPLLYSLIYFFYNNFYHKLAIGRLDLEPHLCNTLLSYPFVWHSEVQLKGEGCDRLTSCITNFVICNEHGTTPIIWDEG